MIRRSTATDSKTDDLHFHHRIENLLVHRHFTQSEAICPPYSAIHSDIKTTDRDGAALEHANASSTSVPRAKVQRQQISTCWLAAKSRVGSCTYIYVHIEPRREKKKTHSANILNESNTRKKESRNSNISWNMRPQELRHDCVFTDGRSCAVIR